MIIAVKKEETRKIFIEKTKVIIERTEAILTNSVSIEAFIEFGYGKKFSGIILKNSIGTKYH